MENYERNTDSKSVQIFNVEVWGIKEALIRAGYPMRVDIPVMDTTKFSIDDKDLKRGINLGNTNIGEGHDKFLRQIMVGFDLHAPRYFYCEFDTYHHFVKNSQSTMHKGKAFDYYSISSKYVDDIMLNRFKEIVSEYNNDPSYENFMRFKANFLEGIHLTAGIVTNYAQLKTIYKQRKNHRLKEDWGYVCEWIEKLPYAKELGLLGKSND